MSAAANGEGELRAIWLKRAKLGPMDLKRTARMIEGRGLEGNANQGGRRQVTVLEAERWAEAEAELGHTVDPSSRRANLLVAGVPLQDTRGHILRVGGTAILIRGETRPCERMERAAAGLKAALQPDWRGGVYGEVIEGGEIAVGDPVRLDEPPAES